ncbi:hypothetical protein ACFQ0I_17440 [Mariniflexile aquimaris]|uniref:YD repeat-containing protein n=1 Tax=Mariniflexile aquimaris TaxID=881009 RepID=A0ABW3BX18_9FLAO
MKNFTFYILTFFTILVYAQQPNEKNWNYNDFIDNYVNKVSKYSIQLRKNGKIKKRDSTLLFTKQIDLKNKTVFGIECSLVVVTHVGTHLTWNKFKNYYTENGLILKTTSSPLEIEKTKEFGFIKYNENKDETIYSYDTKENLVSKEYRTINNHYSIYESSKDTFHLKSIDRPEIYEYVYNSDNQEIKQYHSVDSTRYLRTKSYNPENKTDAVTCSYCHSKYLNIERKYDEEKNLIEWTSYTRENKLHTKRYYYYDNQNRLKKQIDSTGWYVYNKPIWKSTKTYEYDINQTIEIVHNNTESMIGGYFEQEITVLDANENVIRDNKTANYPKESFDYIYEWKNGKLIERTETKSNGEIIKQKFEYNHRNLITEKSEYRNGKRTELIRYYYE